MKKLPRASVLLTLLILSLVFLVLYGLFNYLKGPEYKTHLYVESFQVELSLSPGESRAIFADIPEELETYITYFHWLDPGSSISGVLSSLVIHQEVELNIDKLYGTILVSVLESDNCRIELENETTEHVDLLNVTSDDLVIRMHHHGGYKDYCAVITALEYSKVKVALSSKILSYVADYTKPFNWFYVSIASIIVLSIIQLLYRVTIEDVSRRAVLRLYKRSKVLSKINIPRTPPYSVGITGLFVSFTVVVPRITLVLNGYGDLTHVAQLEYEILLDTLTRLCLLTWTLIPGLIVFILIILPLNWILRAPIMLKSVTDTEVEEFEKLRVEEYNYAAKAMLKDPFAYLYYALIIIMLLLLGKLRIVEGLQAKQMSVTLAALLIPMYYILLIERVCVKQRGGFYKRYFHLVRADTGLTMLLVVFWCLLFHSMNSIILGVVLDVTWKNIPPLLKTGEVMVTPAEIRDQLNLVAEYFSTALPLAVTVYYYGITLVLHFRVKESRRARDFIVRSIIEGGIAVSSIFVEVALELKRVSNYGPSLGMVLDEILEGFILSLIGGYLYELKDFIAGDRAPLESQG